jgi:hypothetical protein
MVSEDAMKMSAAVGRRAWMILSLLGAMGLSTLGPNAFAATEKLPTDGANLRAADSRHDGSYGPRDGKITAKAEAVILLGTNDGTGLDPKIEKMPAELRAALKRPPLSAYNSYKLSQRIEAQLDKGDVQTNKLTEGGNTLSLTLKDIAKGKEPDAKLKYVLTMSIEGRTVNLPSLEVNASKDDYFFVVAPQKVQGGALVIGIRILP